VFVNDQFEKKTHHFNFNKSLELPILAVVHGTQTDIAWKILRTGFVALSSVDAGFYGKGTYFSSYSEYALPYTQFGTNPCFIIAFIIPGNVYPVSEQHDSENSLMGAALKPGYNSHYVVTKKNGNCVTKPTKNDVFDEIVLEQEKYVVPLYIIELDFQEVKKNAKIWERKLPQQNLNEHNRTNTTQHSSFKVRDGDNDGGHNSEDDKNGAGNDNSDGNDGNNDGKDDSNSEHGEKQEI